MSVPAFQRRRRGNVEVEDASQGRLGPGTWCVPHTEFQDAGCLLISEVFLFFSRPGETMEGDTQGTAYVHPTHTVSRKRPRNTSTSSAGTRNSRPSVKCARTSRVALTQAADQTRGATRPGRHRVRRQGPPTYAVRDGTACEPGRVGRGRGTHVDSYVCGSLSHRLASKDEAQLESLLNELAAIRRFA